MAAAAVRSLTDPEICSIEASISMNSTILKEN
jgi:hypothetical protein